MVRGRTISNSFNRLQWDGTVIPASDSQQHKDCLLVNMGYLRAFSLGRIIAALLSVLLLLPCLTVPAHAQQELVAEIDVHGNRRIPTDTIKSRMFTKAG